MENQISMAQYIRDYLLNDTKLRDLIPANVAITTPHKSRSPTDRSTTPPCSAASPSAPPPPGCRERRGRARCGGGLSPSLNRISRRSKSS